MLFADPAKIILIPGFSTLSAAKSEVLALIHRTEWSQTALHQAPKHLSVCPVSNISSVSKGRFGKLSGDTSCHPD